TVTNVDLPGHLIIKKLVVNTNGGTMRATDFSFSVNGGASTAFLQDGIDVLKGLNTLDVPAGPYSVVENATPIAGYTTTYSGGSTDLTLTKVGNYSVAENAHPGYGATFSTGCTGTIALGETRTCTVTNDDLPPRLTLIKHVVNDNGGTVTASAFTLTASGTAIPGGSRSVPGTEAP